MNILIIFDSASGLPYIIRSFENHDIYGPTTNDLLLFDYASLNGFMYTQRQLEFYNGTSIVADGTYPAAQVNPTFAADFFDGLPLSQTTTTPAPPKSQSGYGHAELGEYWRNSLWGGPYTGTLANLTYTNVANELPNLHLLKFTDYPIVEHLVLEFDDGTTIVFEAPPHQTDLVIEYVTKTRNSVEIVIVRLLMEAISAWNKSRSEDEDDETMEFETFSIVTRVVCSIRPTMPFNSTNEAKYQNNVDITTIDFLDDTPFEAAVRIGATQLVKAMIDSLNKHLPNSEMLRNYVFKHQRKDNKTAFFSAAENLQLGVLRLFLEEYNSYNLADVESLMATIKSTKTRRKSAEGDQALQAFKLISGK